MRAAILLAAGSSRRFRGGNKLLARHAGTPLLRHALQAVRALPAGRIIVVVGHDARRVAPLARGPRTHVIFAPDHRAGMAASVRAGLAALWPAERTLFLMLGDVPAFPAGLPTRMMRALRPDVVAVRPMWRREPGHPVLLRRPSPAAIARLDGDRGLHALIAGHTRFVGQAGRAGYDIDSRRDLAHWRARGR